MIVIRRDGRTTVIRGWRAWLLGAAVTLAFWVVLALVAVVVAGIGLTVGFLLLLIVPAAVAAVLLAGLFGRRD